MNDNNNSNEAEFSDTQGIDMNGGYVNRNNSFHSQQHYEFEKSPPGLFSIAYMRRHSTMSHKTVKHYALKQFT